MGAFLVGLLSPAPPLVPNVLYDEGSTSDMVLPIVRDSSSEILSIFSSLFLLFFSSVTCSPILGRLVILARVLYRVGGGLGAGPFGLRTSAKIGLARAWRSSVAMSLLLGVALPLMVCELFTASSDIMSLCLLPLSFSWSSSVVFFFLVFTDLCVHVT